MNNNPTVTPIQYMEQLNSLENVVPSLVKDFKKYYVYFHTTPENQEYKTMFENIQGNLNTISTQLLTMTNDLYYAVERINKQLFALNREIDIEKEIHQTLEQNVKKVENKNNASIELISDYTQMYDYCYMRNWAIFLSFMILILVIVNRK